MVTPHQGVESGVVAVEIESYKFRIGHKKLRAQGLRLKNQDSSKKSLGMRKTWHGIIMEFADVSN